jgi:hypothetical protein
LYPFFAVLRKMQMKLKENAVETRQFRVRKNGSTWPINMKFSLIPKAFLFYATLPANNDFL